MDILRKLSEGFQCTDYIKIDFGVNASIAAVILINPCGFIIFCLKDTRSHWPINQNNEIFNFN